jgi:hypothetical protein
MKRLLLGLALLLLPAGVEAQNPYGTKANETLKQMFTQSGYFGPPGSAADPFACTAQTKRSTYYNTTSDTILYCNGTAWGALGGGGSLPVSDSTTIVCDNADPTKCVRFELSGIDTATTRVVTLPNANTVMGVQESDSGGAGHNTWFGNQLFAFNNIFLGTYLAANGAQTPDVFAIQAGLNGFSTGVLIIDHANSTFDFAHAAPAHPTLWIHSANQNTTQWIGFNHDGTNGQIATGTGGVNFIAAGTNVRMFWEGANVGLLNLSAAHGYCISSATAPTSADGDTCWYRQAADQFQFGEDKATPDNTWIKAGDGSGTNVVGAELALSGGASTGNARGGALRLLTAPSGASSGTLNTSRTRAWYEAQCETLTDNTATTLFTYALGNDTGGGGTGNYCVRARDATNEQAECGEFHFAGVDITAGAGGETCVTPANKDGSLQSLSAGTLAISFQQSTGTDLCNVRVTSDTSLTTTLHEICWAIIHNYGTTITPQ